MEGEGGEEGIHEGLILQELTITRDNISFGYKTHTTAYDLRSNTRTSASHKT